MCGIAGVYAQEPDKIRDWSPLSRMRELLRHRGPDDEGTECDPEAGIGLVHTRLSVIDLSSAGRQPMWSDDRGIALVFNGEIYNFQELRRELQTLGSAFRSRTDTEVIIKGYQTWGIDVVQRLNGMFAFALWDKNERCLWLVRDRLGKKPLYYWHDRVHGLLIFASEIKALLSWPCIRREVDPEGLHCYLALGYVPAPHTMFGGISKLPPGHRLRFGSDGVGMERYWKIPDIGQWRASRSEYIRAIRMAMEQSVERRLVSDVPLGAFLSGGIDSTIAVGVMSRLMREPVRTFAAAFDVGPRSFKYNVDADSAEIVSRVFGTRHTRLTIGPEDSLREHLEEAVWHMDEPQANPTFLTTYLLARLVKEHGVTVILSGDGSDELFGGYSRYFADRCISWLRRVPLPLRRALGRLPRWLPKAERLARGLRKADNPACAPERYLGWWEQFSAPERADILVPNCCQAMAAPERCIESAIIQSGATHDQELLTSVDLGLWIAEESNMRVDKMSMAHALEVRAPFLDYTLAELAMSIPFDQKVGLRGGKRLLKEAFAHLLPAAVLKRPKWGWQSPVYYWLKEPLWDTARTLIRGLPETGMFTPQVTKLVEGDPVREPSKIWSLMVFALWHRKYITSS
jgi:asparagine synthase (glutamine-hydrolysing)